MVLGNYYGVEKLGQWEDKVKDNSVVTSLNIT